MSTTPPGLDDSYHDAIGPGGEVVLTPIPSKGSAPRPWGFWATIGWTVLCLVAVVVVQNLVALAFVVNRMASGQKVDVMEVVGSGLILAVASLTSAPVGLGLIALLVKWRRWSLREYLALNVPTTRQLVISIGLMVLLTAASDGLTYLLGWPVVPRFIPTASSTARSPNSVVNLMTGFMATEEVSLKGSPTVSPTTVAACSSVPFSFSSTSTIFLALSQAPPALAMKIAWNKPVIARPIR